MAADFDVIVCGSLHLDILLYAPSLPRPDETVAGSRWTMQCGGKGGNQAAMAARAGVRTAMIGRVGADDFGARLRANLIAAGVDDAAVETDAAAGSGMSAAIVRDDGDYGAVIVSGVNLRLDARFVTERWRALGGARVLALQNEIPEAANVAIARAARAMGASTILNAAPARAMTAELLEAVDLLVVNRIEAEALGGAPVDDAESALRALPRLGAGARAIIVTLGAGGLVVQPKGGQARFVAARKVAATSTHGAGDCFLGVLAARLAKGASLVAATETASEAAAAHVSRPLPA